MSVTARAVVVFLLATVFWGCRTRSQESTAESALSMPPVKSALPAVVPIDEQGLKDLIAQRRGKVLFLNVWATWCVPCVEEFPDLVRLHEEFGNKDVEVVGISADFDDEVETKIVPFLKKQKVPFQNYVASFKRQDDFINAVDRSWSGALPVSLIFDTGGKRTYFHLGKGTFELFKREIEKSKGGL